MSRPDLVLFDIAGTLVADTGLTLKTYRSVLADAGLPCDTEWLRSRYGCGKKEVFSELLALSEREQPGSEELSRHYASTLEASIVESPPSIFPMVDEVFEQLRTAGCALGLMTGFNASTARLFQDVGDWSMQVVVGSDEVERGRPSPDLVFEAMARVGCSDPDHVACVGDTPRDLQMGFHACCGWNIGVTTGSYTEEELRQCPCTHVFASLEELPGALLGT